MGMSLLSLFGRINIAEVTGVADMEKSIGTATIDLGQLNIRYSLPGQLEIYKNEQQQQQQQQRKEKNGDGIGGGNENGVGKDENENENGNGKGKGNGKDENEDDGGFPSMGTLALITTKVGPIVITFGGRLNGRIHLGSLSLMAERHLLDESTISVKNSRTKNSRT